MSDNPTKLSKFWQELKRRKVVHVITVYASASFVIIELVNNLSEPLSLPANLATIVVIILAVGFPLAIILSWLFDLTSEGVERTKPLSEAHAEEKPVVPNAWKIATIISFVVIAGLVVLHLAGGIKQVQAGSIQSLVVLPFDNFTGDDQLEYFVSGMHSSLISDIGKVSGLRVISKTSSNVYKNMDLSVPDIASQLGVEAVVEATVMCLGDSICLQVKIISAYPEEKQLWTADYKEEKSQILNLYNRITKQIADEVKIELTSDEELILAESKTVNTEAYDAYLKALYYWDQLTPEALQKALEHFNLAIEKDPDWAPAYAGIAYYWIGVRQMLFAPSSITIPNIYEYLNKAVELDPHTANTHYVSAMAAVWTGFNWDKGESEFLKVLEINPNDAYCRAYYGHLLMFINRPDDAIKQAQLAVDLDPLNPLIRGLYAVVLWNTGNNELALAQAEEVLSIVPFHPLGINILWGANHAMGNYKEAFRAATQLFRFDEETTSGLQKIFDEQGYTVALEKTLMILNDFAKNNAVSTIRMAAINLMLNKSDEALDWLENGLENRDPDMPYISTGVFIYKDVEDHPRFLTILEKMNLPPKVD